MAKDKKKTAKGKTVETPKTPARWFNAMQRDKALAHGKDNSLDVYEVTHGKHKAGFFVGDKLPKTATGSTVKKITE